MKTECLTRNHSRLNMDMLAYYQILVKGIYEKEIPLFIKTIGKGGLMFISPIPLSTGKEIEMRLYYYSKFIEFTAKGVWSEKVRKNDIYLYKSGAIFTNISDENIKQITHIVNLHMGNLPLFA